MLISPLVYADDLTEEKQAISESKAQYELLSDELLSLNSELATLNIEIENLNTQINDGQAKIDSTKVEIENTQTLLDQTESEISEKEAILAKRIRNFQKSGLTSNLILYIIDSESVSDLFDRFEAVKKIVNLDKELIAEIEEKKMLITENMEELNNKQEELVALQASLKESLKEVENKKS